MNDDQQKPRSDVDEQNVPECVQALSSDHRITAETGQLAHHITFEVILNAPLPTTIFTCLQSCFRHSVRYVEGVSVAPPGQPSRKIS